MIIFSDIQARAIKFFPKLQIKFKDQSILMKILGFLLFFNPKFKSEFTTTIGHTIYYPNANFVKNHQISAAVILLHEITHIYDFQKQNLFFEILYLFPQILAPIGLLLGLLLNWKIALFFLVFLLPIPAYFRMLTEKKAYTISLYVLNKLNNSNNFNIDLNLHKTEVIKDFMSSSYYFMWPFKSISRYFDEIIVQLQNNQKPNLNEPELFNIVDQILGQ